MFDPFNDYETQGYLRNLKQEKDLAIVKKVEQAFFEKNLGKALGYVYKVKTLGAKDLLYVHKLLFGGFYPWAGKDRSQLEDEGLIPSNLHVSKGTVEFLHPSRILVGLEYTLQKAASPKTMNKAPGTVLGELALAHPFLDGNGRTLLVIFSELCRRADFSIDWFKTNKKDYLEALTKEIQNPTHHALNTYLLQFKTTKLTTTDIEKNILTIRGLDSSDRSTENKPK